MTKGRSEARVFTSIWSDDLDFRSLTAGAQWLYFFLITQPDLTHCGVIPFRPARWAARAQDLTVEQVEAAAEQLAKTEFVVIDHEAGELLVRSLMRRDRVLRQPFLINSVTEAIADVESLRIRAVMLTELLRIRATPGEVNGRIAGEVDGLIAQLGGGAGTLSGTLPDTHPNTHPDTHSDTHPDTHPPVGSREGFRGEGERNGSSKDGPPIPLSPLPPVDGTGSAHSLAAADPAGQEGEGDGFDPDEVSKLVGEIKLIRPQWAARSIARALAEPSVAERPWAIVRVAALAVARDKQSQQPGRLAHDGPWWHQPAGLSALDRIEWCGECSDPVKRQVDLPGGVARCPRCHPLTDDNRRRSS